MQRPPQPPASTFKPCVMAMSSPRGRGFLPPGCVQSPGCCGRGNGMGGQGVGLICNWLFLGYAYPSPWAALRLGLGLTPLGLETTEEGPLSPPNHQEAAPTFPGPTPTQSPTPGLAGQCQHPGLHTPRLRSNPRCSFPRGHILSSRSPVYSEVPWGPSRGPTPSTIERAPSVHPLQLGAHPAPSGDWHQERSW